MRINILTSPRGFHVSIEDDFRATLYGWSFRRQETDPAKLSPVDYDEDEALKHVSPEVLHAIFDTVNSHTQLANVLRTLS